MVIVTRKAEDQMKPSARFLYADKDITYHLDADGNRIVEETPKEEIPEEMDTHPSRTRAKKTGTHEALRAMERTRLQNEAYKERFEEQLRTSNEPFQAEKPKFVQVLNPNGTRSWRHAGSPSALDAQGVPN